MANLSHYWSNVMSKVQMRDNKVITVSQPEVHEVKFQDQNHSVLSRDDEITSDSNVIPLSHAQQVEVFQSVIENLTKMLGNVLRITMF